MKKILLFVVLAIPIAFSNFNVVKKDNSKLIMANANKNDSDLSLKDKRGLGLIPYYNGNLGTISYGLYPQSLVNDIGTIYNLNSLTEGNKNGWFFYQGSYYAKTCASIDEDAEFDDESIIIDGKTYWFKCEPIQWNVFSSNSDNLTLVSSVLLDIRKVRSSPSAYQLSGTHTWLNDGFYKTAFNLDSSYIQTTSVTTKIVGYLGESLSEKTNDNVFLLSYQEYNLNCFADNASRICKPTDWAKANGAREKDGGGRYITRSKENDEYYGCVQIVDYDGSLKTSDDSKLCVRPAITIKLY